VKVITGKIKLELRNGIGVDLAKDSVGDIDTQVHYGYIYCSSFDRSSSVFAKITESSTENESNETIIKLDKRIAGEIADNDMVSMIISPAPPQADTVFLAIPSSVGIPQGDWTNIVKESNLGKIVDYGNKLSFVVPSEIREPYVVQSQILTSLPFPPVIIHEGTKFQVLKKDQANLAIGLQKAYTSRSKRAKDLEIRVASGYHEQLLALKNGQLENLGRSLEFTTNPKTAFEAIKTAFTTYYTIEDNITIDTETNFVGNVMFATSKDLQNVQLVEMIISGKDNNGLLAIWIYGENKPIIEEKLRKEVLPKVGIVIEGMKEGPELIQMYCAGNCGEMLKLEDMADNGIIKCPACDTQNMIPSRLRIH